MLAWCGVFGLGVGRLLHGPHATRELLIALFSAWALALALLMVARRARAAARGGARPDLRHRARAVRLRR